MKNNQQVYTTYIVTSIEKAWQAITNPEFTKQYWGGHVNVSDWKVGSKWEHQDTKNNNNVRVTGKVLECTPPKKLVISWFAPSNEVDSSTVSFELEQIKNVVCLTVTHGNFIANSEMENNVSKGWPLVIAALKSLLETGEAIDIMSVKGPCNSEKNAA